MKTTRRAMIGGGVAAAALAPAAVSAVTTAPTPTGAGRALKVPPPARFTPDWASLTAGYSVPDWFRDAKFGIWAHWTAQCVPEAGDWYAREMYLPGSRAYNHHLQHYGHPADVGFMEIQNLWKAERWDPAWQLDLYKRAGARYFMALANHHDNLDTYVSRHHPWNTTRVGPRKDIIGTWAKLARERNLRFAVSNHSAHAWHWNQPAYGYDPEGPRAGQRYDAFTLTAAKGAGKWWQGLDPQQLYTGRHMPMPDGIRTVDEANAWHEATDRLWTEGVPAGTDFARNWLLRCQDLIQQHRPDMVYFDNFDLPLEQHGLEFAAWYYNQSMQWHGGRLEAVVTAKTTPPQRRMGIVDDVERGGKNYIERFPWQTDTCLGNWHYDADLYARDGYKSAATVIHTLCDVVSKNGNLMLSVPMRGDGTIDDKEERILEELAGWMGRFGQAIYGTRPWRLHGEGPTRGNAGLFSEDGPTSRYTAKDIRYVTRDGHLHALVLGWPEDNIVRLTLLGRDNPTLRGQVARVTLPGDATPLAFRRTGDALEVTLPAGARHPIGVALILSGQAVAV
ncbi:alpha-L-fucosidase [Sphingomonas pseudosanguinis]|uniref:alpha-L-fucosidase n=1 Tax=Sphingomonas pseudosanguinis TaxID=413712 RepID=A0A7W6AFJ8_9SPHN|nr:alpha-L-fucosidase [Sphingomonas pseudosanguinis]MBB3881018.1 alpha-L-fucosidase [Sphingomonas pseudosanguinis]MBN3535359.1 alpha-L-fucosidase [Sphingomonas pseudosanguinis]